MSLVVRRELFESATWAAILAVPISIFGGVFSMGLAHSSSVVPLLFFWPALLVLMSQEYFGDRYGLSEGLFLGILLSVQLVGYFVMVFLFRCLIRTFRRT
jgi:hypothetical protein